MSTIDNPVAAAAPLADITPTTAAAEIVPAAPVVAPEAIVPTTSAATEIVSAAAQNIAENSPAAPQAAAPVVKDEVSAKTPAPEAPPTPEAAAHSKSDVVNQVAAAAVQGTIAHGADDGAIKITVENEKDIHAKQEKKAHAIEDVVARFVGVILPAATGADVTVSREDAAAIIKQAHEAFGRDAEGAHVEGSHGDAYYAHNMIRIADDFKKHLPESQKVQLLAAMVSYSRAKGVEPDFKDIQGQLADLKPVDVVAFLPHAFNNSPEFEAAKDFVKEHLAQLKAAEEVKDQGFAARVKAEAKTVPMNPEAVAVRA